MARTPEMLRGLLLAAWLSDPLQVEVEPLADLDAQAVRTGIELRMGERAEGWQVRVHSLDPGRVRAELVSPNGEVLVREVPLMGLSPEDRARELAATLALVMEDERESATDAAPPPPSLREEPAAERTRGWLAVSGDVSLGRSIDLAGSAGLQGGVWLLHDHLQPLAELAWIRSASGALVVDGARFGAGLSAGASVARHRIWLGGAAIARGVWAAARAEGRDAAWTTSTFVGPLFQARLRWFVVGARVGLDLTLPPLRFRGNADDVRWGMARFAAGLSFGVVIPAERR